VSISGDNGCGALLKKQEAAAGVCHLGAAVSGVLLEKRVWRIASTLFSRWKAAQNNAVRKDASYKVCCVAANEHIRAAMRCS
jgi:hypothetical protein